MEGRPSPAELAQVVDEYAGHESARDRTIAFLRETLSELEAEKRRGAQRIEMLLEPSIVAEPNRLLSEWDVGPLEVDEVGMPAE